MRSIVLLLLFWQPAGAIAQTSTVYSEPARGGETRAAFMDALRPHAEWMLGPPVEFVIHDIRVSEEFGFASVTAQRPGGVEIDLAATPGVAEGDLDPEFMDGATLQALYRKSGETWVAQFWEVGATDVWYADPAFCPYWAPVLPEICNN